MKRKRKRIIEDHPYDRGYWAAIDRARDQSEDEETAAARHQYARGWKDAKKELADESKESGAER